MSACERFHFRISADRLRLLLDHAKSVVPTIQISILDGIGLEKLKRYLQDLESVIYANISLHVLTQWLAVFSEGVSVFSSQSPYSLFG